MNIAFHPDPTDSTTLLFAPPTHQVINSIKDITEDEWDSVAMTSTQTEGRQQWGWRNDASPLTANQSEDEHEHAGGNDEEVNPFVLHAFLSALETSGSVTPETGWLPRHLVVR